MGDLQVTTVVDADEKALFDDLSDIGNLPRYFARMTSARPGDGREVHTVARMPAGQEVEGEAWFTVDHDARRIDWGSEGPDDYPGSWETSGTATGAEIRAQLHTTRVGERDSEVQQGIEDTLSTIKRLVEQQDATA